MAFVLQPPPPLTSNFTLAPGFFRAVERDLFAPLRLALTPTENSGRAAARPGDHWRFQRVGATPGENVPDPHARYLGRVTLSDLDRAESHGLSWGAVFVGSST